MRSTPQRNMNGGQRSGRSTNSSTNGDMDFSLSINQDALPVTSVAVPISTGAQLLINACGRTVALEMQCARTILDLQSALQTKLQMEAQTFHFFDVHGATLATDAQVHDAITQGATPLCATLTDASIHFIENRREELAQMQWKLVRDQMTAATGKIAAIARQVNGTQTQLEAHKNECDSLIDRVHKEVLRAVESERDVAQCENRQVAERVSAVAQLVSTERQKRDVALQGIEKQLSALRDMVENERCTRRQDLTMHMSIVTDTKAQLEGEKAAREALEDKHAFDVHTIIEKAEATQRHITDMLQDQHLQAANTIDGMNSQFQGHIRNFTRMQGDLDTQSQEMRVRFVQMEERCAALENRIADVSSRQTAGLDRLVERHERVAQQLETIKLEERQNQSQVQAALNQMKDLENYVVETEGTTRELVQKEREGRDDQLRRIQLGMHSQQQRQLSELEEKIADRFERESCERERNVQQIFEEVGKGSPNKAFTPARGISMPARPDARSAERAEVFTTSNLEASVASSGPLSPPATLSAVAVAPNGPTALALTQQVTRSSLGALQMQMQPAARTSLSPVPMAPRSATQTSLSPSPAGSRVMVRPPDGNQLLATTSSNGSSRGASVNMQAPGAPRMVSPPPSRGASINLQAADKPFMGQAIQARISPSPTPLRQSTPGTR